MAQKRQGANARLKQAQTRAKILSYKPGRLVVIAGLLMGLGIFLIDWIPKSGLLERVAPLVAIKGVEIRGCTFISEDSVLHKIGMDSSSTILNLSMDTINEHIMQLVGVESVKVKRTFGKQLQVTIHERIPTALAIIGGKVFFMDASGALWPFRPGKYYEYPVVTGLKDTTDTLGFHSIIQEDNERLHKLITTFSKIKGTGKRVISYDVSSPDMVILQWNGILPEIRIALHDLKFAVSNIETLLLLLEEKELRASEYIDFSYRNVAFIR